VLLRGAQVGKAGFMERIEEPYPDYAMMASLMQQGAAGPSTSKGATISGGVGGTQKWGTYGAPARPGLGDVTPFYNAGVASQTLTFGPAAGGPAHQATPGYGLGESIPKLEEEMMKWRRKAGESWIRSPEEIAAGKKAAAIQKQIQTLRRKSHSPAGAAYLAGK